VETLHQQLQLVTHEMALADANLPHLHAAAVAANRALDQGDLTLSGVTVARFAWLDAEIRSQGLHAEANQLAMTLAVLLAHPIQNDAPGGRSP
jgi:hypothetical protein